MCEIKFRAKYKDSKIKEWAYGSLDKTEWDSSNFKYKLSTFFELLEQGFLDPETVGQITGLKDKNGKEGYKSDIIKGIHKETGEEVIGEVVWDETWWRSGLAGWGFQVKGWIMGLEYLLTCYNIEVIGDRYTTPELLKGENR